MLGGRLKDFVGNGVGGRGYWSTWQKSYFFSDQSSYHVNAILPRQKKGPKKHTILYLRPIRALTGSF